MNKAPQHDYQDTIYATASAPGRGGVAVVRVSGQGALESALALCDKDVNSIIPRYSNYVKLCDPVSRETIDHALMVYFKSPASFTGEDIVEYHVHGGTAVVSALHAALANFKSHRLALPGEFTRRAFENGKLDLTAAEAVADLVDAETSLQRLQALDQLSGSLGDLYLSWADTLRKFVAHIEADLEFPDEDMPDGILPDILPRIKALASAIADHLNDGGKGERLRDGIKIAVVGAPNAGKSSLVNALSARDVAIVSDLAGTTRDIIEVPLDIGGYPVLLQDTAGLRPKQLREKSESETLSAHDAIESEGIKRALNAAKNADIRLLVFDITATAPDPDTMALIDQKSICVFNKADEGQSIPKNPNIDSTVAIALSVAQDKNLDGLTDLLKRRLAADFGRGEQPSLTRARHRDVLVKCQESLERALNAPLPELVAEDLRLALRELGRMTGHVHVEELLDTIFKDFCIGK